ncbi:radical SAM/SPASM domain-containing protein [Verrucomicrobiota bacterium]
METIAKRKKKAVQAEPCEEPLFPKEIFLDLTSCCNHRCIFCANSRAKQRITMPFDLAKRILKDAYDCGVRDAGLYATGESFLVDYLPDVAAYAKSIGFEYLFITTNGSLATPERAKAVLDAGLDSIKFSICAGKRETYREIHGRDDFDKVLANLRWVSAYRQESGLQFRIYVTMVYTNRTEDEVDILRDLVVPYIDEWDPHPLTNQCGNMYENNELGTIDAGNPRGRVKSDICFQPFKGFTVTPEGLVTACVLDYSGDLVVGDAKKESLGEIWKNAVYRAFRRRHMDKSLEGLICYNCMHNRNEPVTPLTPEHAHHFKD